MPVPLDLVRLGRDAERDLRQDRELVGGVGAVHVERRVGLGVAELLRLGEGVGVAQAALGHRGEDEVRGAVEDALDGGDLVGRQALAQRADDRHAAGDRGLEADGALGLAGGLEDLVARVGEQRLVRGDDVLAGREGVEHDLLRGGRAADEFDDDVDRGVVDRGGEVGGDEFAGERRSARGLSGSRTTTRRSASGRPARRARRSCWRRRISATPPPTVPQPIKAIPSVSLIIRVPSSIVIIGGHPGAATRGSCDMMQ